MNHIGISQDKLKGVAKSLNDLLCSYSVYYQNLRSAHWNIQGQSFFQLHNEFETIYNDAKLKIDDIAERILTLGFQPVSKMSSFVRHSKVKEIDRTLTDKVMVGTILKNQNRLISQMRIVAEKANKIGDEGTVDLIGGMIGDTEKRTWMLAAWLSE